MTGKSNQKTLSYKNAKYLNGRKMIDNWHRKEDFRARGKDFFCLKMDILSFKREEKSLAIVKNS